MSRDRRPEGDLTSDQTPEQTENDEQSTPTSADEYGSLTVEDRVLGAATDPSPDPQRARPSRSAISTATL
jgi:hypothetical protein